MIKKPIHWLLTVQENGNPLKSFAIGDEGANIHISDIFNDSENNQCIFGISSSGKYLRIVNNSPIDIDISNYVPSYPSPYSRNRHYDQQHLRRLHPGETADVILSLQNYIVLRCTNWLSLDFTIEKVDSNLQFISPEEVVSEMRETTQVPSLPTISDTIREVVKDKEYKETLQSNKENLQSLSEKIDELNRGLKKELTESIHEIRDSLLSLSSEDFFVQIRRLDTLMSIQILPRTKDDDIWKAIFETLCDIRKKMILAYGVRGVEEYCPLSGEEYNPLVHDIKGDVPTDSSDLVVDSCLYSGFRDKDNQIILHPIVTIMKGGIN